MTDRYVYLINSKEISTFLGNSFTWNMSKNIFGYYTKDGFTTYSKIVCSKSWLCINNKKKIVDLIMDSDYYYTRLKVFCKINTNCWMLNVGQFWEFTYFLYMKKSHYKLIKMCELYLFVGDTHIKLININ